MIEPYQVVISKTAQKEIRSLQNSDLKKVLATIKSLSEDPRPSGCKKLVASKNTYRIRIGNYRVLYFIEDTIRIVEISGVRHRKEAYD
jgi:mRNA interferase RelE/StbE